MRSTHLLPTNLNKCTYDLTGENFRPQYWKRCIDCFPSETEGACLNCIVICHSGHRIEERVRSGNFYCNCGKRGNSKCQLVNRIQIPSPTSPRHVTNRPRESSRDRPIWSAGDDIITKLDGVRNQRIH